MNRFGNAKAPNQPLERTAAPPLIGIPVVRQEHFWLKQGSGLIGPISHGLRLPHATSRFG